MRLDPEIKAKVEATIGREIPHPATPEFDELLQELRGKAPEVALLLESGVVYDEMPFPEEEVRPKVEKRERLRRLRNLILNRYDPLTGEWVPSRPKQIAVGFAIFLLFFVPFFLIANRPKGSASAARPAPAQERSVSQKGQVESTPPGGAATENTPPGTPSQGENPEAEGSTTTGTAERREILLDEPGASTPPPPPPPPTSAEGVPSPGSMNAPTGSYPPQSTPPSGFSLYRRTGGGPALSAASSGGTPPQASGVGGEPASPSGSGGGPGGLSLYSRKGTPSSYTVSFRKEGASPRLTVYTPKPKEAPPSEGAGAPSGGGRPLAEEIADVLEQARGGSGASDIGRSGAAGRQRLSLAFPNESQTRTSKGGFYLYRSAPNPPEGVLPGGQPASPTGGVETNPSPTGTAFEGGLPQTGFGGGGLPPQTGLGGGLPPSVGARAAGSYPPGSRLKGQLPVTLILQEGKNQPVVVEAEDGALFSGEAFLNEARRAEIRFTSVIRGGLEEPINAIAVGEDGAYGLPATVREEAPSLAADLLRGTLRGFSDYLQAATRDSEVSFGPGGTVIQEKKTPPLENFLAAAAAELFSLPQGAKAVVRLAEVKEGTPLSILVLSSNSSPNPRRGPGER